MTFLVLAIAAAVVFMACRAWWLSQARLVHLGFEAELSPSRKIRPAFELKASLQVIKVLENFQRIWDRATGWDKLRGKIRGFPNLGRKAVIYRGVLAVPRHVYVNDSRNISLTVQFTYQLPVLATEEDWEQFRTFHVESARQDASITFEVTRSLDTKQFMEVQLLAAAATVAGDPKQRQPMIRGIMSYNWNCYFANSGVHEIALAIRVGNETEVTDIGRVEWVIKVAQLDHLTQGQVRFLSVCAAVIGGAMTMGEQSIRLGVFKLCDRLWHALGQLFR